MWRISGFQKMIVSFFVYYREICGLKLKGHPRLNKNLGPIKLYDLFIFFSSGIPANFTFLACYFLIKKTTWMHFTGIKVKLYLRQIQTSYDRKFPGAIRSDH